MPYLKKAAIDPMTKLLRSYGLNGVGLADVLNACPTTGAKRMQNPGTLTLDEIRRLNSHGHIPIDEIRQAI